MIRNLLFELRYLLGDTPWDTEISPPELIEFMETHPPGQALDLGCGTGTNALTISSYGWEVIGVDSSHLAIRRAEEKAQLEAARVEFQRLDVSRLRGLTGEFNLILDIGCYHSLSLHARARYIQRVAQLIHPRGTYLLYTWLSDIHEAQARPPSAKEIEQEFSPHFARITQQLGTEQDRTSAWYWMQVHPA